MAPWICAELSPGTCSCDSVLSVMCYTSHAHEQWYRINPLALALSCSSVWNHIALGPREQFWSKGNPLRKDKKGKEEWQKVLKRSWPCNGSAEMLDEQENQESGQERRHSEGRGRTELEQGVMEQKLARTWSTARLRLFPRAARIVCLCPMNVNICFWKINPKGESRLIASTEYVASESPVPSPPGI